MKTDFLKAALAKKNSQNQSSSKQSKSDAKESGVKSQVSINKPAKKSAGRGR
jgi:hypothetical protein